MADMNVKAAGHHLRTLADAIQKGEIADILCDPSYGLTPEFRECLERGLTAVDPRGLAEEIEGT